MPAVKLKAVYQTSDEIPEQHRELFEPRPGGGYAIAVEGGLLADDHKRLVDAIASERDARSKAERELKRFAHVDVDAHHETKRRVAEMEAMVMVRNEGQLAEIDREFERRSAPLRREHEARMRELSTKRDAVAAEHAALKEQVSASSFAGAVGAVAEEHGVHPQAVEDVVRRARKFGWSIGEDGAFTTKSGDGIEQSSRRRPGSPIDIAEWFRDVLPTEAPHVFGAKGSHVGAGAAATPPRSNGARMTKGAMSVDERIEFVDRFGFEKYRDLPD